MSGFNIFWYVLARGKWSNLTIIFLKWVGSTTKLVFESPEAEVAEAPAEEEAAQRKMWMCTENILERDHTDTHGNGIWYKYLIYIYIWYIYIYDIYIWYIYIYIYIWYIHLLVSSKVKYALSTLYRYLNDFCVVNFGGSIYPACLRKGCITLGIQDLPWK